MVIQITELIGFIGTILIIIAYLPQMRHIIKEHCAGGVSLKAWLVWLVATILIFIHALTTSDTVFITLQIVNIVAIIIIIVLIIIYSGKVCHSKEIHMKKK